MNTNNSSDIALEVHDLSKSFGDNKVLKEVSFELHRGELVGLIGPSNSGKSVLLKCIAGILEPDEGSVTCNVSKREDIDLMFQEGALFDSLTLFQNVAFPLVQGRIPITSLSRAERDHVADQVGWILTQVGLFNDAHKLPAQLSGGMKRRASLARALVTKPELALLDDPTCGLDPVASSVIMELITGLHAHYKPTMILVSHDLRRLLPIVDTVLMLDDGRVTYDGSLSNIMAEADKRSVEFISCRYDLSEMPA